MSETLHEKIYNDILKKIHSHQYEEGVMLPTELEMVSVYGASKAPIRQALGRLEQEGLIVRRAGKGTFVAGRSQWPFNKMSGSAKEYDEKGKFLYCITISLKKEKLPKEAAEILGIPVGADALGVERIRYYKDEPIQYLHHYIVNPEITKKALAAEGNFSSLLALYDKLGFIITRADDILEAVGTPREVAKWLKVEPGHPILLNKRTTYGEEGKPIEFVTHYMLTRDWKYRTTYLNSVY